MLVNIHLHGKLGKTFGKLFRLDVASPAEAVRALMRQRPGFTEYLCESESKGFAYRVRVGKRDIGEEELITRSADTEYHFFPIPLVHGGKAFKVILGVVLIVASVYLTGGSTTGTWLARLGQVLQGAKGVSTIYTAMAWMGTSLILNGVSEMIMPGLPSVRAANNDESRSYLFNGANTNSRQGGPVPLGYGRLHVGPQIISLGISTTPEVAGVVSADVPPIDNATGTVIPGSTASGVPDPVDDGSVLQVNADGSLNFLGGITPSGQPIVPVRWDDGNLTTLA